MVVQITFADDALKKIVSYSLDIFHYLPDSKENWRHESSWGWNFCRQNFLYVWCIKSLICNSKYRLCFSSLPYAVLITLTTLMIVVACRKHATHQVSFEQNQSCIRQSNNYDDASIATGLSDDGDQMKMMELKTSIFTTVAESIYDSVGEGSTAGIHQHVAFAQSKPELPRSHFSPSSPVTTVLSSKATLAAVCISWQLQWSISASHWCHILESSYSDPNAKPYMVPVVRSYEEVANPAHDYVDMGDDGYMHWRHMHGCMNTWIWMVIAPLGLILQIHENEKRRRKGTKLRSDCSWRFSMLPPYSKKCPLPLSCIYHVSNFCLKLLEH